MFKDFIISTAITILAKAIQSKPNSKVAKILLDERVKNTIRDVSAYYIQLEMMAEEEEEEN